MNKYNYILIGEQDVDDKLVDAFILAFQDSPFPQIELDRDQVTATAKELDYLQTSGTKFLMAALHDEEIVGLIAAIRHPLLKDTGQEIIWWVHKDHRKSKIGMQLIQFMEEWATSQKLKYLFSGHYHNDLKDTLSKLYERQGYTPVEYSYMKEMK